MNKADKTIFLLGVILILIFAPLARGAVRIWSMGLVLLIETFLIFLWLWRASNQNGYSFRRTALDYPILIFTILAVVSFTRSVYKHDSFYALLGLLGYAGIYYMIVNEFDHAMRRRLLWAAVAVGTFISFYGILQYFGLLGHGWWFPQNFLSATYVNHNHFAGFLEIAIPVASGLLLNQRSKNWNSRLALLPALVIMAAAFLLSQSRGAWVSLAVSFMLIGAIITRRKIFNVQNILIFIIAMVMIASLLYFGRELISNRMSSTYPAEGGDVSMLARLKIWRGTIDMIRANPLTGVGIGDFIWAFPRFRPEGLNVQANAAHNDYLQVAAETGIPALLVMIWILAALIVNIARRSPEDPVRKGCAIGILSLSLHGLVDFNFHIPANVILFTVCAAIALTSSRPDKEA